jgi:predicted regulator of Ras-like GTPase activity (Roadblock/LC7/MglB family)
MKQRVKGRVENLTLASFLQLLEMERKTCSLAVSSLGHHGLLYLREGHLVGAEMAGLKGQPAALEIVTWENADIEISDHLPRFEPEIEATLRFLLMEGMRLKDERQESGALVPPPPVPAPAPPPPLSPARSSALDLGIAFGEIMKRGQDIKGSQGLLLVDTDGGEVLGAAGAAEGVDLGTTMALPAAQFLRQERRVAERLGLDDPLQDVIVTTSERYYLIRAVGEGEHFLLLVLDRHKANLAKAQLDLVALERSLAG